VPTNFAVIGTKRKLSRAMVSTRPSAKQQFVAEVEERHARSGVDPTRSKVSALPGV
jgi:hypothetical protein